MEDPYIVKSNQFNVVEFNPTCSSMAILRSEAGVDLFVSKTGPDTVTITCRDGLIDLEGNGGVLCIRGYKAPAKASETTSGWKPSIGETVEFQVGYYNDTGKIVAVDGGQATVSVASGGEDDGEYTMPVSCMNPVPKGGA